MATVNHTPDDTRRTDRKDSRALWIAVAVIAVIAAIWWATSAMNINRNGTVATTGSRLADTTPATATVTGQTATPGLVGGGTAAGPDGQTAASGAAAGAATAAQQPSGDQP